MIDRPSGASVECIAGDNGVMVAALVLTGAPGTGKSSVVTITAANRVVSALELGELGDSPRTATQRAQHADLGARQLVSHYIAHHSPVPVPIVHAHQ
jgi:hypothetical protein